MIILIELVLLIERREMANNEPWTDEEFIEYVKKQVNGMNKLMDESLERGIAIQIEMVSRGSEMDPSITVPAFAVRGANKTLYKPGILIARK